MEVKIVRTLIATVGIAVCAGGLAAILSPSVAAVVPVDEAVARLGNDYLLVAILGGLGAAATLAVVTRHSVRGIEQADLPDPEGPPTGRRPGAGFDTTVDARRGLALSLRPSQRERVRERLQRAAVGGVTRATGCSRNEARRRIEQGTWTDDGEAAAFLAGEGGITILAPLEAILRGETPVRRRVRRTVLAIDRLERGADE